jgi:hypothetical protein
MWTIKKLDYSSSPWRLIDENDQEVYEEVTIDHPEVGKSRVSMPFCGATKQEVMQKVIAGFVKIRGSAKKQRLALQIIQTWASCDGTSPETRSKAMDDIVNKCREALA